LKFTLRLKVGKLFLPKTLSQTQLAFTARLGLGKGISQETQRITQETVSTASAFAMLGQGCPNCWPRGGIVVLHSKEKRATARSNGYSVWEPGLEVKSLFQEFWLMRIHGEQSDLPGIALMLPSAWEGKDTG